MQTSCLVLSFLFLPTLALSQEQYLDKARHSRDFISTYFFDTIQVQEIKRNNQEIKSTISTQIWCNGKSFRQDIKQEINEKAAYQDRVVYCTNCDGQLNRTLISLQGTSGSSTVKWHDDGGVYAKNNRHYFDWKYAATGHERFKVDTMIAPFAFLDLFDKMSCTGVVEDSAIQFLKNDKQRGITHELWISTVHHQPVFMKSYTANHSEAAQTAIKYVQASSNRDVFVPQKYETRTVTKFETSSTTVDFIKVEYNLTLPASVFTLKGLRLLDGTPVELPGAASASTPTMLDGEINRNITMENNTILAASKVETEVPTPATPRPSLISQAWPYFLGFVVFAVLGFWLIRKQRKAAKEG
jgi:hypothetical protein